jgi:hypothetical protein
MELHHDWIFPGGDILWDEKDSIDFLTIEGLVWCLQDIECCIFW